MQICVITVKRIRVTSSDCNRIWATVMLHYALTFTAHASYPLGRHLNISTLPQARRFCTLGQPQPQSFKYFALNIFREISLILSTTLEVFPASCFDWSTCWEKTTYILFLYEAVCTKPVRLVLTIYKLIFFAPFGWLVNDLLYRLITWPHTIWVIAIWWQATISRTVQNGPMQFFSHISGWVANSVLKR